MTERKMKYRRQAETWLKPEEGKPIEFRVASAEHFATYWQHWIEEERRSYPCTVEFKWNDGKPFKRTETCKYCDRGLKAKPRFLWDVFVNGELVTIAMNSTSHKNIQKFLANVELSGKKIDDSTYILNPVRTDQGWIKYEFSIKMDAETKPTESVTFEDTFNDVDSEEQENNGEIVLSDIEKEVIKEHEEQIFGREWKEERLAMAIKNALMSKGAVQEKAEIRGLKIAKAIIGEQKEAVKTQL